MNNNDWQTSAKQFLANDNYQEVVNLYENFVEKDPECLSNYWYLGLAYLLNKQGAEAQTTWFIPFTETEEDKHQSLLEELSQIIILEADRIEEKQEYELVWVIRSALKEINPENIGNLLELLRLSVILKTFQVDFIYDWNILKLLTQDKIPEIEINRLIKVLDEVLKLPTKASIDLAEASLIATDTNNEVANKIKTIAHVMGIDNLYVAYAIDLLCIYTKFIPDNWHTYRELYLLYMKIQNYDKALEVAEIIKEKSDSLEGKILGNNFLFNCYLTIGKWDLATETGKQQIQYWETMIRENYEIKDPLAKNAFIVGLICPLYLKDDLAHNRHLFNGISKIFYQANKENQTRIFAQEKETRKLRLGYIGHTFRTHSVGFLCRWLINYHNPDLFDVNIYSVQGHQDNITQKWFQNEKIKQFYDGKRDVNRITNKIYDDQIDILIEVDSVTLNLTASVMVNKPAPIQVSWLGLDASGLPSIDYYIADPYVLPDNAEQYYREKIWRLPNTYLAIDGFNIATPTLRREDFGIKKDDVVFMNLQNPAKLNPDILKSQLEIIKQVPNSYLFIKIRKDESALKELVISVANLENLPIDKLRFIPFDMVIETHRANLQIADVILDTYPYNGSTTTLEALWLDIPVVTRVGEQFAARNSYTYMMNAGITEGIAWSNEKYIEWGIKFGTDENLRKEVSWKLRQSKKTSPLWNAKQFAREMEKAYQQMWDIYVNSSN
ncbi:O-linked N-acetylglucosamine transferase, SPINDLY family protein [Cyanobacterium aponinum AL20118]|uniref:O-linked N-acetylglucosamine transferase, SPINDLY family protein n=1 Tax=Cyanobacterium aponinum AL20115 TaxID=3090662 RepID=A0AAF0ZDT6_9CHRO|nr:O-linked N-acetylglucosamine transferase, SPINDLY family protein [Cyanobacterium aponinum]WPF90078.1 O-linked N-acetylglucosamine transferase, SPINDLY family protein [Cyanobacterium aponinum AL20115]